MALLGVTELSLPIYITNSKELAMLQTNWAQQLDPVIAQPLNSGLILENVPLKTGPNVINHKLGRKLQGWSIVRMIGSFVQVYDTQDSNQMPSLTLNLNSSGTGTVNLLVF